MFSLVAEDLNPATDAKSAENSVTCSMSKVRFVCFVCHAGFIFLFGLFCFVCLVCLAGAFAVVYYFCHCMSLRVCSGEICILDSRLANFGKNCPSGFLLVVFDCDALL